MKTKIPHLVLIFVAMLSVPLRAMFAPLIAIPIDRMVEDLQSRQAADPENALWTYRLGRSYYLGFEMGVGAAFSYNPKEIGKSFPDEEMLGWEKSRVEKAKEEAEGENFDLSRGDWEPKWEVKILSEAERIDFAEKAYSELKRAVKQDPKAGLYFLTLASFQQNWLESGLTAPERLRGITIETMMNDFEKAWRVMRKEDLARRYLPIHGVEGLYSAEAAKAWLTLSEKNGISDPNTEKQMRKDLKKLSKLRMGMVTPVVLQFKAGRAVPVLLDVKVEFDLIGDQSGGSWNWINEGAAFLVWDPDKTGKITSGRQFFGGYTWQMFWKHGFEPLQLMDRDFDGVLEGAELIGLSAWFDRAPLGVSSEGEVVPLTELGVTRLKIKAQEFEGEHAELWHPEGVELKDGTHYPLWDWLAIPSEM